MKSDFGVFRSVFSSFCMTVTQTPFFFIGKEAYNREKQGGWLITNIEAQIKETLDQKPEKVDLLAELTKVSGRIAFNYETVFEGQWP